MKDAQNFFLCPQDGFFGEAIVTDSTHDGLHEERCDVLVLAREEHACDPKHVQLVQTDAPRHLTDEAIKQLDREEESLLTHVEGRENFEHPVNHAGTTHLRDSMPRQVGYILGLPGRARAPTVHAQASIDSFKSKKCLIDQSTCFLHEIVPLIGDF